MLLCLTKVSLNLVSDLIEYGLLSDKDIKNPNYSSGSEDPEKKNPTFNGCIKITNTNNKFTYVYQSIENCNE